MRFEGLKLNQRGDELQQYFENGKVFEVIIDGATKKEGEINWTIDLGDGYVGYIPASESGTDHMNEFVGSTVYAKINSIDHDNNYVLLSRSAAIDFMRSRLKIKPGDIITAAVKFVAKSKVNIDVGGGVMVAMNRDKATLSRSALHQIFKPGQIIKVVVEEISPEILCNRVATLSDPWNTVSYQKNDQVAGTAVSVKDGRVLIEVKEGLVGIAPMPLTYEVSTGDRVRCQVVKVKADKKQLRLRIKGLVGQ